MLTTNRKLRVKRPWNYERQQRISAAANIKKTKTPIVEPTGNKTYSQRIRCVSHPLDCIVMTSLSPTT